MKFNDLVYYKFVRGAKIELLPGWGGYKGFLQHRGLWNNMNMTMLNILLVFKRMVYKIMIVNDFLFNDFLYNLVLLYKRMVGGAIFERYMCK